MAQVTMDSREYIELLDKARAWDKLNKHLVEDTAVLISEDHYMGYRVEVAFGIPEEAKMGIASKVVESITTADTVMRALVDDAATVLDLASGYIGRNWGHNKAEEVDLMQFPAFKAKYQAIEAEMKEEE